VGAKRKGRAADSEGGDAHGKGRNAHACRRGLVDGLPIVPGAMCGGELTPLPGADVPIPDSFASSASPQPTGALWRNLMLGGAMGGTFRDQLGGMTSCAAGADASHVRKTDDGST
jgi:hypothetical protein